MAYFLLLPTNENGIIIDNNVKKEIDILTQTPFDFDNFFMYSHGWWTNAINTMSQYNFFSVGLGSAILQFLKLRGNSQINTLGVGIHWPSTLSEDHGDFTNFLEALSFYTMEKRADSIGTNAGYSLIRLLLERLAVNHNTNININLIGHSFGCKVICSALEALARNFSLVPNLQNVNFNVVLLQAAFNNDAFEKNQSYEHILTDIPNIRLLITKSQHDKALQQAYPAAHRIVSLFQNRPALGAVGLQNTDPVIAGLPEQSKAWLQVDVGFSANNFPDINRRIIIADLSLLHQHDGFIASDPFSGSHNDIFRLEVYQLISGFLFGNI